MKKEFLRIVNEEMAKAREEEGFFTLKDLLNLPAPVKRYFKACGYLGKPKMTVAHFVWDEVRFRSNIRQPWFNIEYQQVNFVRNPGRIAYIGARKGFIPFEGLDRYVEGHGRMTGKIARLITLFDVTGQEMDASAAVTLLSEALIIPSIALQDYIKWTEIDDLHAKATITYQGVTNEGIFTFNEKGENTMFETENRYMDSGSGTSVKAKWTASCSDYVERHGIRMPSVMKATWNLPVGNYDYFTGKLIDVLIVK